MRQGRGKSEREEESGDGQLAHIEAVMFYLCRGEAAAGIKGKTKKNNKNLFVAVAVKGITPLNSWKGFNVRNNERKC